jgi:6-pyruvoyltetrahydropterin/6-carboxytetrahydropterin synthase
MMVFTVRKRFEFDAGHRLAKHPGECRNVHGHRYAVELEFCRHTGGLDDNGMVIDFDAVERMADKFIKENLDHAFLVDVADVPMVEFLLNQDPPMKNFIMDVPPTAENIAGLLFNRLKKTFIGEVMLVSVTVFETPTSSAVASD